MVQLSLFETIQAQVFSGVEGQPASSLYPPAKSRFVLKPDMFVGRLWTGLILLLLLCAAAPQEVNASTKFTFTLDEPCRTSAGVFRADGTLIRTLWSKVPYYAAGTYSATWDGLDNNSNAVAAGTYDFKLLQHNTEYVWDGVIGNTSAAQSGPTVIYQNHMLQAMSVSGGTNFYCTGTSENKFPYSSFLTNSPHEKLSSWCWDISQFNQIVNEPGIQYNNWVYTCADSNWVYFAGPFSTSSNDVMGAAPGCIIPNFIINNTAPAYFTNGVVITNAGGDSYPSGIYSGTQPGLSGMSVQLNGNCLATSVAPDNTVYLYHKYSGSQLGSIPVTSPQCLSFSTDGNLWVISSNAAGGNLLCYTNLTTTPSLALTLTNFSNPLAVAVCPANPNIIIVADGGTNQWLQAIDETGATLWTYGLPGGYLSNGVAVATNKFWFSYEGTAQTFLCYNWDGSFWVGDEENHRALHFSAAQQYLEQIMFQPFSYTVCACQNNTTRVFNQFLEFNVNYTNALSNGWTLVNNWKANLPTNLCGNGKGMGLNQVTTFPNGRTYAFVSDANLQFGEYEVVELTGNQLRQTGIHPLHTNNVNNLWMSFGADGSLWYIPASKAQWYKANLVGFDDSNNPQWGGLSLVASGRQLSTDPVPICCSGYQTLAISTNNILISYNPSLANGWHFGGLQLGGSTNWLWEAGPSYNLNGCGNFEISNRIQYAGDMVHAVDRNVDFGFHGEFFRGAGEASQHMHFYDDGLFVGQYGESGIGHSIYEGAIAGFAGNAYSPDFVKTTSGDYYVWGNDESGHGVQRWHFVNARNIREQIGVGTLGGVIKLTNQFYDFPSGVIAQNGNQSAMVSWLPVQGAASYNIYYSLVNGGPFNIIAGNATTTNYLITGLTNGQTYFGAVTAVIGESEGIPSEQVQINPLDTTQNVLCVGSLAEGGQQTPVIDVSSNAPDSSLPSWIGSEHLTGVLTPSDLAAFGYGTLMNSTIGTQGYVLYDWGGTGSNLTNLSSTFTINKGSGWIDYPRFGREFLVNNILGTNMGLAANPIASINIAVNDNNFHYLTVVSPAVSANARHFTLGIASTNGASVQYSVSESYGYHHTFQFLFRGNIVLQAANDTGGTGATVQGIFLDGASSSANTLWPPTNLHLEPNK